MCQDPEPAPSNGVLDYTGNGSMVPPGAKVEYTCKEGYTLIGPSTKVCRKMGEWQPLDIIICAPEGKTKLEKLLRKHEKLNISRKKLK